MTLHVTSSTVGREAPLAHVAADEDQAAPGAAAQRPQGESDETTDSAAISDQGQRLAALGSDQQAQLKAVAEAEQLARALAARMAQNPSGAAAAQGQPDPSRVAQLLDG